MKYSGHHSWMEFRIPTKVRVQNRCCRYFFARLIVWQNDEYFKKLPSTRRWSQSINNETLSSRVNQLYPQPLNRSPLFTLKKRALFIYVAHRSPLKSANHCPTQDQKRIKGKKKITLTPNTRLQACVERSREFNHRNLVAVNPRQGVQFHSVIQLCARIPMIPSIRRSRSTRTREIRGWILSTARGDVERDRPWRRINNRIMKSVFHALWNCARSARHSILALIALWAKAQCP